MENDNYIKQFTQIINCSLRVIVISTTFALLFSACATGNGSNWEVVQRVDETEGSTDQNDSSPVTVEVVSKQVGIMPYEAAGIVVGGTENWYLGQTPGMKAFLVPGGIRYEIEEKQPLQKMQQTYEKSVKSSIQTPAKLIVKPQPQQQHKSDTLMTPPSVKKSVENVKTGLKPGNTEMIRKVKLSARKYMTKSTKPVNKFTTGWNAFTRECLDEYSRDFNSYRGLETAHVSDTDEYVVEPGNVLWAIADQTYGVPALWPVIYHRNIDIIGDDYDSIDVGQTYLVDPLPSLRQVEAAAEFLCG